METFITHLREPRWPLQLSEANLVRRTRQNLKTEAINAVTAVQYIFDEKSESTFPSI